MEGLTNIANCNRFVAAIPCFIRSGCRLVSFGLPLDAGFVGLEQERLPCLKPKYCVPLRHYVKYIACCVCFPPLAYMLIRAVCTNIPPSSTVKLVHAGRILAKVFTFELMPAMFLSGLVLPAHSGCRVRSSQSKTPLLADAFCQTH